MMCKPVQYKLRMLFTLCAVLLYASFTSAEMAAQFAQSKESLEIIIEDSDNAQAETWYEANDLQAVSNIENVKISNSIYSSFKSLFSSSSTATSSTPNTNCNHGKWNSSRNICVCDSGWQTSLDQDILTNNFEYCTEMASKTSTVKPESLFAQTDAGNKRLFIGLICGGVALVVVLVMLYCYCCRHRRERRIRIESPYRQTPWQQFWNKCTGNQHQSNQLPLPAPLYTGNQLPLPVQDPYMINANNYHMEYLQSSNNRYATQQIAFDRYYNPNSRTQLNNTGMSMTGAQPNEKYISQPNSNSNQLPENEEKFVNSSYNMYNSELSGHMMQYTDAPSPSPVQPTSTTLLSSNENNNNTNINSHYYPSPLSQMTNYNSSPIPVTQYYGAPPVNNTPALQSYETSNFQPARQHSQVREPFYEDYNNNNNDMNNNTNNNNCEDNTMQMYMANQVNGNMYESHVAQSLPPYQTNLSPHRKSRSEFVQPSPIPTSHEPFAESTEPTSQMYEQQNQFTYLSRVQPELQLQQQLQQEQQRQEENGPQQKEHQRRHRHRSNSASRHRNKMNNINTNEVSAFVDPNACARETFAVTQNILPESGLPEQHDQSCVYDAINTEQNNAMQKVPKHSHTLVNKSNAKVNED